MLSISAAVMTWSADAVAASSKLKGDYGYTGTLACIFSPGNPPTTPPFSQDGKFLAQGFGVNQSVSVHGIRTFNGDGTGSATLYVVGVERPTPPQTTYFGDGFSIQFTYSFTYTVNDDDTWTIGPLNGSITGSAVAGPRIGQTVEIDNFPTLTGDISQNAGTLTATSTLTSQDNPVETLKFSSPPSPMYRICERSEVLIKK
jgi:hypothetical protein